MGSIYGLVSPLYYLCDPYVCGKLLISFWHRCQGRYSFVWIDILAKDKFANLSKNFLFFYFLVFICFLFEFCILHFSFLLYFFLFDKVLSIMSNEEMNELFYNLQKECASQAA